MFL
ncbi:unnamed protein product [Lasius platythorax]|jgi:hypothetical protein